jgi:hypothetical protein
MDLKIVFRWVALLPAAALAAIVAWQITTLFMAENPLVNLLGSFAQGYAFVLAGCMVAPFAKKRVSVFLGLTGFSVAIAAAFIAFQQSIWLNLIYALCLGAGAVVATVAARHSEDGVPML